MAKASQLFRGPMELAKRHDPDHGEQVVHQYWLDSGYFRSVPDDREPYTVVIPPPNVTGVLAHGAHAEQHDGMCWCVVRMQGQNACWCRARTTPASPRSEGGAPARRTRHQEGARCRPRKFLEHARLEGDMAA